MRGVIIACCLLFLSAPALAQVIADPHPAFNPSPDTIVDNFLAVAGVPQLSPSALLPFARWDRPVRAAITGDDVDGLRERLIRQLATFGRETGHDLRITGEGETPNLLVVVLEAGDDLPSWLGDPRPFFPTRDDALRFQEAVPVGKCGWWVGGEGVVAVAHALILAHALPSEAERKVCISLGLLQVLGLYGSLPPTTYSALAEDATFREPTWQDYLFLKLLYKGGIPPGTAREAVPDAERTRLAAMARYRPDPAALADAFRQSLRLSLNGPIVARWAVPIKVGLHGRVPGGFEQHLRSYAALLEDAARHPITAAQTHINLAILSELDSFNHRLGEFASFIEPLFRSPADAMRYLREMQSVPGHICTTRLGNDSVDTGTRSGLVLVRTPSSTPLAVTACMLWGIVRVVAGIGDIETEVDSALVRNGAPFPTPFDLALLRLLYDPRLDIGMLGPVAEPIAREIIAEMTAGNHDWRVPASGK